MRAKEAKTGVAHEASSLQEGGRHRAAGSTGEGAQERQRVRAERAEGGEAENAEADTGGGLTTRVISEVLALPLSLEV